MNFFIFQGLASEIEALKKLMRDGNKRDVVVVNRGGGR